MQIIRGLDELAVFANRQHSLCSVVTIGNFDGVHLGHQAIFKQLREQAQRLNAQTIVMTFDPSPKEYFMAAAAPARIQSLPDRIASIAAAKIDCLVVLPFNAVLAAMTAEDFVSDLLVAQLGMQHISVGDDFRFGAQRRGDISLLKKLGQTLGFTAQAAATQMLTGQAKRMSSTELRSALQQHDLIVAQTLLGRAYSISGVVEYGRQLGRTIGVPTANVKTDRVSSPLTGVFAVQATVQWLAGQISTYQGVANLGVKPTVNTAAELSLEVHLFAYEQGEALYGQTLTVTFEQWLRDEQKFDSIDALKNAIHNDIADAKQWFATQE